MSDKNKILHLTLKRKWFDLIKSGEKKEEYRLVKPHWTNKLVGKKYTHIVFRNGYGRNAPHFEIEYNGYEIKNIRHEFFGNEDVSVFAIKLK